MPLTDYLKREGIDTENEPASLSRERAKERVIETAYYNALLSDSTHHGINHNAKVNTVSKVVKSDDWPQFDHDDFVELDDAVDKRIQERSSSA